LEDFYYVRQLDNKSCVFKIDTGFDMSIVNKSLVVPNKIKFKLSNCNLRYPAGEKVVIKDKVFVEVQLDKHLVEIPMLIANINDNSRNRLP